MESLYVLQLADGKYYVGKTKDVKRRIEEHNKGAGSEWTRLHRPVKVIETRKLKDEHDENNTTKDYMKKYGVDNVRGGSYSQVDLPTAYEKALTAELRGNSDACFKCGAKDHFVRDCPVEDEESEEEESEEEEEDGACYRCGRTSHYASDCYAYSNVRGQYIGKPKRDPRYEWSDDDSD